MKIYILSQLVTDSGFGAAEICRSLHPTYEEARAEARKKGVLADWIEISEVDLFLSKEEIIEYIYKSDLKESK